MRLNNESGLSIIEIIVVVFIIAGMAAILTPNFLNWLPEMRLKAAANDLLADMQQAKIVSIRNNGTTNMLFNPGCGAAGSYIFTDNTGTVFVNETMENGICINLLGGGVPLPTTFNSRGFTGIGGGLLMTIQAANPTSRRYRITQSTAGGVTLQ